MLQVLRSEGVLSEALVRAPDSGEPADFELPEPRFRALLAALEQHHRERAIGLLIGERITEPNLHAGGALVSLSRTMQEAYASCSSLMERAQMAPAGVLELRGERAVWVLSPSGLGELWEDLMIAMCFHTARRFLQGTQSVRLGAPGPLHAHLARPRPAQLEAYLRCFGGAVSFEAPQTMVSFPRAFLALPRPGVDPSLAADLRLLLLRRALAPPEGAPWRERVEFALRERSSLADLRFEPLAERWGLSLRTLRRRLAQEGSSLSELLDKVRFERARDLLANTRAPQAEIAEALGYADESSFRRAFKRWAGGPPHGHRKPRVAQVAKRHELHGSLTRDVLPGGDDPS